MFEPFKNPINTPMENQSREEKKREKILKNSKHEDLRA
jgi:hypothetical protein